MGRTTMPVSVWMVDALGLQPGHEVLELAAGTGEVGFLAAEQIAPDRHADLLRLRARDDHRRPGARREARDHQRALPPDRRREHRPAGGVARRRAVPLGLHADGRPRGGAARDAADPQAGRAASRWRRGRARRENPWASMPMGELVERGHVERPEPGAPGQFALGAPGDDRGAPRRRRLHRVRGRHRRLRERLPVGRRLDRDQPRLLDDAPHRARAARPGRARGRASPRSASRRCRTCARTARPSCPARSWVAAAAA